MNKLSAVIARRRELQTQTDELRSSRKKLSKQIGGLMREKLDEVAGKRRSDHHWQSIRPTRRRTQRSSEARR